MNKQLESLIQKEMTRKEFLTTLGLGVASIFGLGTVVRLLSSKNQAHGTTGARTYGSSTYGG